MDWSNLDERLAYAEESHRLALELWDYVFPPWRWIGWHRRYRVVCRRVETFRREVALVDGVGPASPRRP